MQEVPAAKRSRANVPRTFAVDARRIRRLRSALLGWAAIEGRHFFWRGAITPFEVLVTEILLAKTRAELVSPIARTLLDRYGSPAKLERAPQEDLEALLYPLGLHKKRAKHLVACATVLVRDFDGVVPGTVAELMRLPFVGRYAANAIACVAFGHAVPVIDANVSRIYQRMFSLPDPPDRLASAHDLWALADRVLPKKQAKAFNWAILDLGGTVCTAKAPRCDECPLMSICDLRSGGAPVRR
jgi:A/G-specific adenine glycosylase